MDDTSKDRRTTRVSEQQFEALIGAAAVRAAAILEQKYILVSASELGRWMVGRLLHVAWWVCVAILSAVVTAWNHGWRP